MILNDHHQLAHTSPMVPVAFSAVHLSIVQILHFAQFNPAPAGGINRSTVPMVDWVLLGSGESNKGQDCGSLYCSLPADAPCLLWQEHRAVIVIISMILAETLWVWAQYLAKAGVDCPQAVVGFE